MKIGDLVTHKYNGGVESSQALAMDTRTSRWGRLNGSPSNGLSRAQIKIVQDTCPLISEVIDPTDKKVNKNT